MKADIAEARRRLAHIKSICGDDEVAHSKEDDLHEWVLGLVAAGHPDSMELARLALLTRDIPFSRWCA